MDAVKLTMPKGVVLTEFGFLLSRQLEMLVKSDTGKRWAYLHHNLVAYLSRRENLSFGQRLEHMQIVFPTVNLLLEDAFRAGSYDEVQLASKIERLLFPKHPAFDGKHVLSEGILRN